ncbi:MAG: HypC/HybG/HupF family hydrogenase formation chaperone [Nitrososphaeraceae archaeon]
MCLAFPGKIIEIQGDFAKIDFGANTTKNDINISHVNGKKGDYVLVHAGYAIEVLDLEEAENIIEYWRNLTDWKCKRCEISEECPTGNIVNEINLKKIDQTRS